MDVDSSAVAVRPVRRRPPATAVFRPNVGDLCTSERKVTVLEHAQLALLRVMEASEEPVRSMVEKRLLPLLGRGELLLLRVLFLHALCTEDKLRREVRCPAKFFEGLLVLHASHVKHEITHVEFVQAAAMIYDRLCHF